MPVSIAVPRKTQLDNRAIDLLLVYCMFWGFQLPRVNATMAKGPPVFRACVCFASCTGAVALWCRWAWALVW